MDQTATRSTQTGSKHANTYKCMSKRNKWCVSAANQRCFFWTQAFLFRRFVWKFSLDPIRSWNFSLVLASWNFFLDTSLCSNPPVTQVFALCIFFTIATAVVTIWLKGYAALFAPLPGGQTSGSSLKSESRVVDEVHVLWRLTV